MLTIGMISRMDDDLETAQPKNVGIFEKMGFSVLREPVEPSSGLQIGPFGSTDKFDCAEGRRASIV